MVSNDLPGTTTETPTKKHAVSYFDPNSQDIRIVGGTAVEHVLPWFVFLQLENGAKCGGALISPK